MTRVGILETGQPSDKVLQSHGNYPQMFHKYFAEQPELQFTTFPVFKGEPLPDIAAQEAWLITGSPVGVYEDHLWMKPLMSFIREAITELIPLLGVCFGHQIMAQAMGGTVVKSEKGRGVGVHTYEISDMGRFLLPGTEFLNLVAMHHDQITQAPDSAMILASSPFCEYAALAYGTTALSLQAHPEFTVEAARDITASWQERAPIDPAVHLKAEESFKTIPSDAAKLTPLLAGFLSGRLF